MEQQQCIRTKPLGELGYYYQRSFLRQLITEFFDRLREVEKLPLEAVTKELIAWKHPLVDYLRNYFENEIRLEIAKLKQEDKTYTEAELEKILLAKDEVWLADRRYVLFRQIPKLEKHLPALNAIVNTRKRVNETINEMMEFYSADDDNYLSTFVSVDTCLSFILYIHSSNLPTDPLNNDFYVKFSFDGRQNGGNETMVGLVPQIKGLQQVGQQTFPLAILKASEQESRNAIHKIAAELLAWNDRPIVTANQQRVTIKIIICTDLSALWTSSGLNFDRRTDHQFCPNCYKKSCDISDWGSVGYRDIIPGLNFASESFIYCSLHAGMRVTETLIKLVAEQMPSNAMLQKFKKKMKKHGISIQIDTEKTTNFIKVYLVGNWMKKFLLQSTSGTNLLGDGLKCLIKYYQGDKRIFTIICLLWVFIFSTINSSEDSTEDQIKQFELDARVFFHQWNILFPDSVTPYIHIITHHSAFLLRRYGSIGRFSQQGFEFANRDHKQITRHGTNKGGSKAKNKTSLQIMQNIYRRFYLADQHGLSDHIRNVMQRKKKDTEKIKKNKIVGVKRVPVPDELFMNILNEIVPDFVQLIARQGASSAQQAELNHPSNNVQVVVIDDDEPVITVVNHNNNDNNNNNNNNHFIFDLTEEEQWQFVMQYNDQQMVELDDDYLL